MDLPKHDVQKFLLNVDPTKNLPKIGADAPRIDEVLKLEDAVRVTVNQLPWRTKQDDAAVALGMNLAKRLDMVIQRGELGAMIPNYKPTEHRFTNNAIRELGELLLKTLIELGATPMARSNLNIRPQGEARANPIEQFRNGRQRRPGA